ncbi:MAG: hypothetical protein KDD43_14700, partial [Bdellovibrionales bacterium]|nr:hypothetical protein [Bdellovibrionales bacterium]
TGDYTSFYKREVKGRSGTLQDLNARERYANKIVAFACYDSNLNNNPRTIDVAWDSKVFETETFIQEGNKKTHLEYKHERTGLGALAKFLASFPGGRFIANDGLVPIQSALFLDISNGDSFATSSNGQVSLDLNRIEARKLARKHHIYCGDHLSLLDSWGSESSAYWTDVVNEITEAAKGE